MSAATFCPTHSAFGSRTHQQPLGSHPPHQLCLTNYHQYHHRHSHYCNHHHPNQIHGCTPCTTARCLHTLLPRCPDHCTSCMQGTGRVFRQTSTLEDAIGTSHACSLEAQVSTGSHCKLRPNTEGNGQALSLFGMQPAENWLVLLLQ
jgi:hypothetical protein